MMKTTNIYIEVPVAERLPEKYSFVFTDMGKGFVNDENNWIDYDINDIYPSYWLEPVEVPTDELQKLKINQK